MWLGPSVQAFSNSRIDGHLLRRIGLGNSMILKAGK